MKKKYINLVLTLLMTSCSSAPKYKTTVSSVDLNKFMGKWYVMAGRFTPLEKQVHNAIETYSLNPDEKNRIDVDFTYNKGSFAGPTKKIPQTAWVKNLQSNAEWKVSPFWPLKFDYLIVGLASDYSWTVIGVPDQKYVWIMSRSHDLSNDQLQKIITEMKLKNYNMDNLEFVKHKYD